MAFCAAADKNKLLGLVNLAMLLFCPSASVRKRTLYHRARTRVDSESGVDIQPFRNEGSVGCLEAVVIPGSSVTKSISN